MTATEIIELLRRHPQACGVLQIHMEHADINPTTDARVAAPGGRVVLYGDDDWSDTSVFREWLTGACVEWCDERGITTEMGRDGYWQYDQPTTGPMLSRHPGTGYATRLHALLAGLEAHCKESK